MPKIYKWSNPYEWLGDYLREHPDQTFSVAMELAEHTDSDVIQDLFQSEMDKDGYFQPINNGEEV